MTGRRVAAERWLRVALAAVAVLGVAVAGYLTWERAAGDSPACVIGGGCATVQKSEYSELAGVPVAYLGLAAYLGILACALIPGLVGRVGGLVITVGGFAFSAWLTYVELGILDAVCAWCIASAVLMTLALGVAAARMIVASDGAEPKREAADPRP